VRGDVFLADLNPSRGSEQAGIRPVIVVQRDNLERFTRTVVVVPLTSNMRRAQLVQCSRNNPPVKKGSKAFFPSAFCLLISAFLH